jgi:hypothetical protein
MLYPIAPWSMGQIAYSKDATAYCHELDKAGWERFGGASTSCSVLRLPSS